jgi:hypothetical protein
MNTPFTPAANADDDRDDAKQERGCAEEHGMSAEAARNEAEQVRQLAQDARHVRDDQREALERIQQEQEHPTDGRGAIRSLGAPHHLRLPCVSSTLRRLTHDRFKRHTENGMAVSFQRNVGLLPLAVWLILDGL